MLYISTSYLLSILLLLFIVITVLFKPSLFKRFIIFYFKIFNADYYQKYHYDDDTITPKGFLYSNLVLIILIPFVFIPVSLIILFIQRINKILENND